MYENGVMNRQQETPARQDGRTGAGRRGQDRQRRDRHSLIAVGLAFAAMAAVAPGIADGDLMLPAVCTAFAAMIASTGYLARVLFRDIGTATAAANRKAHMFAAHSERTFR